MALGFGFNKAKVLSSAERYVQQGKLQNAIGEYEKVARHDTRDLTVLNTIGDLYARLGQSDKATSYFRKVGDVYAADGFTVKAIAMYKKLTKLAPNSIDGLQKLAELYTQQGLYNDARQHYVVLADHWMKANDLEAATRVFQKMLELDPENAAMQTKLADIYIRMGKKEDAKEIYFRAAESLYQRAALDAADEALARILSIDPGNSRALLKRAQVAGDSGDAAGAVRHLERIPHMDSNPDALGVLLRAHLQTGDHAEAENVARTLATRHKDLSGIQALADWLMSAGSFQQGLALYREFSGQLSVSSTESLERALEASLHKIGGDAASLELVRELYHKLGDKSHINECSELLAHALVQAGDLKRARDLYRELAEAEPENPIHQQHYRQVLAKLGEDAAVRPLTEEEGAQAFMVDELEISAPTLTQEYPETVAEAIKAAVTDSELFDAYNLPEKALGPLEKVLPQAPRDVRLNQRLASLYAEANRFAEAALCCEVLQAVYLEAGYAEQAEQYRDMAGKYKERAGTSARPSAAAAAVSVEAPLPAASLKVETPPPAPPTWRQQAPPWESTSSPAASIIQASVETELAAPATAEETAAPAASAHEIDLSEEWETHAVSDTLPLPAPGEMIELQSPVAELGIAVELSPAVEPPTSGLTAPAADEPAPAMIPAQVASLATDLTLEVDSEPADPSKAADALTDLVSDLEKSLGTDFAIAVAEPAAPRTSVPSLVAEPAAASAPAMESATATAPQAIDADASSVLTDMFAEFKEDAEAGEQLEDPETHYNLGVAFREMGLMDEAIGELQKVCSAIDRGAAFPYTMQTYTWLAQCFVDKGVPDASFKWYDRALKIANDEQQRMSLHYDLASAYEASGNRQAALQHFMEVYGSNIDFRDVAERIKALRS